MPWTEADDDRVREFCKTADVGALTQCPKCGMGAGGASEMVLANFCTHRYCPFREWRQAKEAAERPVVSAPTETDLRLQLDRALARSNELYRMVQFLRDHDGECLGDHPNWLAGMDKLLDGEHFDATSLKP